MYGGNSSSLKRYNIHPQKSGEVVLNCERDSQSEVEVKYRNKPTKKPVLLCISGLSVAKQVDPMSRRFSWGVVPCIVS